MIGSFHDGLMITSNEEIIYHNNKFNSIFEVLTDKKQQQTDLKADIEAAHLTKQGGFVDTEEGTLNMEE